MDRGPGDLRILEKLVALKEAYPERGQMFSLEYVIEPFVAACIARRKKLSISLFFLLVN